MIIAWQYWRGNRPSTVDGGWEKDHASGEVNTCIWSEGAGACNGTPAHEHKPDNAVVAAAGGTNLLCSAALQGDHRTPDLIAAPPQRLE